MQRIAPREIPVEGEGGIVAPPEEAEAEWDQTPIIPSLNGLVLLSDLGKVRLGGRPGVSGVVEGTEVPDFERLRKTLDTYLGEPLSMHSLNEMTRDIVRHYRRSGLPVVDVVVPEQDITPGVVQLVLIEGRRAGVRAEGQRWHSAEFLESQIRLQRDDPLASSILEEDLRWINRSPFRRVDLIYTPGEKFGETDLVLRVEDRFPLRVYTGYENTGNEVIGVNRVFAGFNYGNLWGMDHQLSYQFTASTDFEGLLSHSVVYSAPLPWRHELQLFGAYVESTAEIPAPGLAIGSGGESWQASLRYGIPLPQLGSFRHELGFGFDYKRTNNNLEFGGIRVFDTTTEIFQWLIEYMGTIPDAFGTTSFSAALYLSPGGLTGDNSTESFQEARAFADSQYLYFRGGLDRVTALPWDFSLVSRFLGQVSSTNLLASEQLGAGGYNTVRGYEEREARGDNGLLLSMEVRTPPIPMGQLAGFEWLTDEFQFLAFWDYGLVGNHTLLPGEPSSITLQSLGVGFRYSFNPYVAMRFDYGWQLNRTGLNEDFDSRAHVGVTVSF